MESGVLTVQSREGTSKGLEGAGQGKKIGMLRLSAEKKEVEKCHF